MHDSFNAYNESLRTINTFLSTSLSEPFVWLAEVFDEAHRQLWPESDTTLVAPSTITAVKRSLESLPIVCTSSSDTKNNNNPNSNDDESSSEQQQQRIKLLQTPSVKRRRKQLEDEVAQRQKSRQQLDSSLLLEAVRCTRSARGAAKIAVLRNRQNFTEKTTKMRRPRSSMLRFQRELEASAVASTTSALLEPPSAPHAGADTDADASSQASASTDDGEAMPAPPIAKKQKLTRKKKTRASARVSKRLSLCDVSSCCSDSENTTQSAAATTTITTAIPTTAVALGSSESAEETTPPPLAVVKSGRSSRTPLVQVVTTRAAVAQDESETDSGVSTAPVVNKRASSVGQKRVRSIRSRSRGSSTPTVPRAAAPESPAAAPRATRSSSAPGASKLRISGSALSVECAVVLGEEVLLPVVASGGDVSGDTRLKQSPIVQLTTLSTPPPQSSSSPPPPLSRPKFWDKHDHSKPETGGVPARIGSDPETDGSGTRRLTRTVAASRRGDGAGGRRASSAGALRPTAVTTPEEDRRQTRTMRAAATASAASSDDADWEDASPLLGTRGRGPAMVSSAAKVATPGSATRSKRALRQPWSASKTRVGTNILTGVEGGSFLPKQTATKPTVSHEELEQRKREELQRKREREEEVVKKREELIKLRAEADRQKREERQRRALEARQRQEQEQLATLQRKQAERTERQGNAQLLAEQRRREELQRRQRQRKQEEAQRQRALDEAEQAAKRKKQEEAEAKRLRLEAVRKQKEDALKAKLVQQQMTKEAQKILDPAKHALNRTFTADAQSPVPNNTSQVTSYDMTPRFEQVSPQPLANPDNYNIDDLKSDDDTDDESRPKKAVPSWAKKAAIHAALLLHDRSEAAVLKLFPPEELFPPIRLEQIFPTARKNFHKRTSSANWDTPPSRRRV